MRSPRTVCGIFLLLALSAAPLSADVPTNMNVQGVLKNNAGNPLPAGLKTFTFKIFDQPSGGTEIWPAGPGEQQTLSTDANGLWNGCVGEVIPLTEAVFQSPTRWLQVTVNDGVNPPETLTRIELKTSPYTYRAATSQNADSLGGLTAGDFMGKFVDEVGDTMTGPLSVDWNHDNLGSSISIDTHNDGWLPWWTDDFGFGNWGVVSDVAGDDNNFNIGVATAARGNNNTVDGNYGVLSYADGSGTTNIGVYSQVGTSGISNYSGYFVGGDFAVVSPQSSGTTGVVLPPDVIDHTEILNEPGLSKGASLSSVQIDSTLTDMATTTIVTPTPGYIHVVGRLGLITHSNAAGSFGYTYVQIDEVSGGTITAPYFVAVGFGSFPNNSFFAWSVTAERTFYKPAGSYTFRLEALETFPSVGTTWSQHPVVTAVFYPSSYGAVSTYVDAGEAGDFDQALPQTFTGAEDGSASAKEPVTLYQVDLRELELRAAKEEAEAERARRELLEARMRTNSPVRTAASVPGTGTRK